MYGSTDENHLEIERLTDGVGWESVSDSSISLLQPHARLQTYPTCWANSHHAFVHTTDCNVTEPAAVNANRTATKHNSRRSSTLAK